MLKALKAEREFKLTSKQFVHNIYDTCLRQVGVFCLILSAVRSLTPWLLLV